MTEERHRPSMNEMLISAAAYILFFIPLIFGALKNPFVRFHYYQGLGFFIFAAALRGILAAMGGPPSFMSSFYSLSSTFLPVAHLILIALIAMGIYNVFQGKMSPLPVIGKYIQKMFS